MHSIIGTGKLLTTVNCLRLRVLANRPRVVGQRHNHKQFFHAVNFALELCKKVDIANPAFFSGMKQSPYIPHRFGDCFSQCVASGVTIGIAMTQNFRLFTQPQSPAKCGIRVRLTPILLFLSFVLTIGCNSASIEETAEVNSKARVKVTIIQLKDLDEFELIPATVVYLNKSDIVAPVSGYITKVAAQTGYPVGNGQVLFNLETKEHRVIQRDTALKDEGIRNLGVYAVKAPGSGYITAVMHQEGDYVQEGTALCAFTRSDQIYVKAFVPVRLQSAIQKNTACQIILPDNSEAKGVVSETMHELDPASQSLQVLIKLKERTTLSENMNMQVKLPVQHISKAQVVPKAAVLSSEKLDKFWVMQLINDSVAVKIPITTGITQNDSVQIIQPVFSKNTRILYDGNYGLPDTVTVQVIK